MHRIGKVLCILWYHLSSIDNYFIRSCIRHVKSPEKDQPYGWASDGEFYNFITWTKLRANVQKVEVQFRDDRPDQYAQIAELEIYYCD